MAKAVVFVILFRVYIFFRKLILGHASNTIEKRGPSDILFGVRGFTWEIKINRGRKITKKRARRLLVQTLGYVNCP